MIISDFQRVSESVKALNPHLFGAPTVLPDSREELKPMAGAPSDKMNKTEREFAAILDAMKARGEIVRYEYEGVTLRWADMRYTPDFIVFGFNDDAASANFGHQFVKLIEVKGAHIWDRDIVRFKGARAFWPEFAFEMHQKARGEWKRIY